MPKHEIAAIYDGESKILIVGSFPSPKSREQGFYYAHPQNRMWKVLARVFGEKFPETKEEREAFLHRNHIAMWDVLESCDIDGASDTSIRNAVPNDFDRILKNTRIGAVFTAGSRASQLYERFQGKTCALPHISLPSTSPANAAVSEDGLTAAYLITGLFAKQDLKYRDFIAGMIPNVAKETFIGVRTPDMRAFCKRLAKDAALSEAYRAGLPHRFYEENGLHSFFIEKIDDYDSCLKALDAFLPYVDNWATCDSMKPKVFEKNRGKLRAKIAEWMSSGDTYTVRFGIELLMNLYLDDEFAPEQAEAVAAVCPAGQETEEKDYYIRMMVAWYFATALAKQWNAVIGYLERKKLSSWVHAKTIQKARESYRITEEQKEYLKSLK